LDISKVGVVGCGLMGSGIAEIAAKSGFEVRVREVNSDFLDGLETPDAKARMVFLRNRLAQHENYVAEYYYRRGAFAAAANRAKYVLETYEGAPAVADSLFIIVNSYQKLGMQDLAADARRILEENYPEAAQPKATRKRFFFF